MITIGHMHTLTVTRAFESGYYLDAEQLGEVLLEKRWVSKPLTEGEQIRVFLYRDGDGSILATTQRPLIEVGQFAYLKVAQTTPYGAFMDWGLEKNLLVPFAEQHLKLETGRSYLVYAYVNAADQRIVGSTKVDKYIDYDRPHRFKAGDTVKLTIANFTPLGFKAIINRTHWGLLKKEDVFQRISFGQRIPGFIQSIRPDGKINLTLNGGHKSFDKNGELILDHLLANNGFAPLHDKSAPEQIYKTFRISKSAFKNAIGTLYKQQKIVIQKDGIRLVEDEVE